MRRSRGDSNIGCKGCSHASHCEPSALTSTVCPCRLSASRRRRTLRAPQVEQLAALEHDAPVWKVEWDLWGNQVAAATEARQVAVYRPNLVGSWVRQVLVAGQEVEDQEEDDGEEGGSD